MCVVCLCVCFEFFSFPFPPLLKRTHQHQHKTSAQVGMAPIDLAHATEEDLNGNKDLVKAVLDDLVRLAKEAKLNGFEIPKGAENTMCVQRDSFFFGIFWC